MSRTEAPAERGVVLWVVVVAAVAVCVSIGSPLLGLRAFHASDALLERAPWKTAAPDPFLPTNDQVWDTVNGYLPMRADFRQAVLEGHFALWSPYPAGGSPLGDVPDVGTLSPLNLPYLVLPLWYAPGVAKLIEMAVAIGFMFLFLRRIGLGRPAALVGGLAFAFSGFQVVWTNWPHTHVGALIPALFWAIERGIDRKTLSGVVPVALVTAVMILEGFPSVTGYALVAGGMYALVRLGLARETAPRIRLGTLLLLGAAVALALGITALQLLPFIHRIGFLDLAYRRQTPGDHLPLGALITLAIPNAFGSPIDRNYVGANNYIELQSFIGASALVLVTAAAAGTRHLRLPRGVRGYLWIGALITGILIFWGGPLLGAFQHFPLFGMNFIGRLRAVFGFFLAAVAALGLEAATAPARRLSGDRWRALAVWLLAGVVAILGLAWAWRIKGMSHAYLTRHAAIPVTAAVLTVLAIAWEARTKGSARRFALWLVPVLVAAEALAFALPFWPRIPIQRFYPSTPAHEYLLDHVGLDRIASAGKTMSPGTTTFYGLRALTAHTFYQPTWKDMIRAADPGAFRRTETLGSLASSPSVATSPLLDRLSVRYFVTAPEANVFGEIIQVSAPVGTVDLAAGSSLAADVPNRQIRAVVVQLSHLRLGAAPVALSADVVDGSGTVLAQGQRRIFSTQKPGRFQIPVVQRTDQRVGAGPLSVRLSLLASEGSVSLGADSQGGPALSVVAATDDGLNLVFADGAVVYERTRALPRIRWAPRSEVIVDPAQQIERLRSPMPADTVILGAPGPAGSGEPGRVDVLEDSADEVRVSVTAGGAGYLVVTDAMQDGWRAYVDGRPADLSAADHAGVAVLVPAGAHDVTLRYEPSGWRQGLLISGLSLVVLILVVALGTLRRRRRRRRRSIEMEPIAELD